MFSPRLLCAMAALTHGNSGHFSSWVDGNFGLLQATEEDGGRIDVAHMRDVFFPSIVKSVLRAEDTPLVLKAGASGLIQYLANPLGNWEHSRMVAGLKNVLADCCAVQVLVATLVAALDPRVGRSSRPCF